MNLINDDCMNILPDYPDDYFDLAIVDPPYGKKPMRNAVNSDGKNAYGLGYKSFNSNSDKWDIKPNKEYFDELFRVSKNQIIWGMNYFIDYLKPTNCVLVWDKDNGKNPFADCELAWTSFTTITKKYRFRWQGMLQENMNNKEKVIHPTQKPVALYRWLLENYAEPTDKILDTHLGSGSSAIACHYFGTEEFIGIEIDKEYFDMASERIAKETRQIKLL